YQVSRRAIGKGTIPFDFDQQNLPRKVELCHWFQIWRTQFSKVECWIPSLPLRVLTPLKWPFPADELQVETRDSIASRAPRTHHSQHDRVITLTGHPHEGARLQVQRGENCRTSGTNILSHRLFTADDFVAVINFDQHFDRN